MYTSIICILIGVFLLILVLALRLRIKKIQNLGIETEGIVFGSEEPGNLNLRFSFPTIRFITTNEEWITETYNLSLPFLTKGQKVRVIYNPKNPKEFIIKTKLNNLTFYVLGLIGAVVISFGILFLFNII